MQIIGITGSLAARVTHAVRGAGGPPSKAGRPGGDGGRRGPHGGPAGGPMAQAVMQTLSQLGLLPSATDSEDASPDASTATPASRASADRSADSPGALREDLHALVHALFQALRGNSNGSSNGNGSDSSQHVGPPPDLRSALRALATQAANGQAPAPLQQAFDKLGRDLQAGSPGSGAPSLQTFLQSLQQQVGPGRAPQMASTGQSLQVQA